MPVSIFKCTRAFVFAAAAASSICRSLSMDDAVIIKSCAMNCGICRVATPPNTRIGCRDARLTQNDRFFEQGHAKTPRPMRRQMLAPPRRCRGHTHSPSPPASPPPCRHAPGSRQNSARWLPRLTSTWVGRMASGSRFMSREDRLAFKFSLPNFKAESRTPLLQPVGNQGLRARLLSQGKRQVTLTPRRGLAAILRLPPMRLAR
jgi:hypothetical protein